MERTLTWRGEEFSIPVDFKLGWNAGNRIVLEDGTIPNPGGKVDFVVSEDIDMTANSITELLEVAREKAS